ncbi:AraC family transcriptional regulator [Rhizobium lentis]|uniref:AraC family transcriptional regulator n=2 Tax=Rhizobium lentis TaxID=1138194 RepID=A0A9Q3MAP7_9HYPH|nr:AraC family transcriptional regulator [Rhizobium lentis]MBX4976418.1 AraC family transcriptional regulator [Rhizobium lentis]MBX4988252.1 AraC family transcriptional regulator [Rhizobium lentis]MBX4998870.1 AraC family transcriptional regulator [Rhizobium lentis]MBX5006701.1 AraC family transcriptional regulator [Rhizobium lentis]
MLASPQYLRDSPAMPNEPFSDILKLTRAETLVTGGFTAGGPWALRFPIPKTIKFFAVLKGSCWVTLDGQEAINFSAGDVGLLSAPLAFELASDPSIPPVDAMSLFSGAGRTDVRIGDGSEFAHIGGHVLLDATSGRLLTDVLPPWIHVQAGRPEAATFRWLLDRLAMERANDLPGAELAAAQLAQLLFIEILRAHLSQNSVEQTGWLRALADPGIVPAIRLMHANPARAWHLEDLAEACAMSRTTFAERFRTVAGIAPLAYLTNWRMRLAERALREEARQPVASIATTVGYASESSFSNAFKRITGASPREFRNASHRPIIAVQSPEAADG